MSDPTFTHDVFLSHSAKDKEVVRPLAERLRQGGLKVWFDEWEIKPVTASTRTLTNAGSIAACPCST